jgi:hypothetical protein
MDGLPRMPPCHLRYSYSWPPQDPSQGSPFNIFSRQSGAAERPGGMALDDARGGARRGTVPPVMGTTGGRGRSPVIATCAAPAPPGDGSRVRRSPPGMSPAGSGVPTTELCGGELCGDSCDRAGGVSTTGDVETLCSDPGARDIGPLARPGSTSATCRVPHTP